MVWHTYFAAYGSDAFANFTREGKKLSKIVSSDIASYLKRNYKIDEKIDISYTRPQSRFLGRVSNLNGVVF